MTDDLTTWTTALWPWAAALLGTFLLLALRFLGMAWTAPLIGSPATPWQARCVLAVLLAVAVTPLQAQFAMTAQDWMQVAWLGAGELVLGAALGLGIRIVLSGLELAAGLIDHQSGATVGHLFHPENGTETSPSGQLLALLGCFALLSLRPLSGDLLLTRVVLDSLRSLPPGVIGNLNSPVALLQDLVLQALWLGLRVAAPVLVILGLLQLGMSWITRRQSAAVVLASLTPLRIGLTLVILLGTLTNIGGEVADACSGVFLTMTATGGAATGDAP